MKKSNIFIVLFLIVALFFLFIGFLNKEKITTEEFSSNDKLMILEKTWNQLNQNEKGEMSTSWEEGTVEKVIIEKDLNSRFYVEEAYLGKEVYCVTFQSINQDMIGDIQKIVEREEGNIVGYSFRD